MWSKSAMPDRESPPWFHFVTGSTEPPQLPPKGGKYHTVCIKKETGGEGGLG